MLSNPIFAPLTRLIPELLGEWLAQEDRLRLPLAFRYRLSLYLFALFFFGSRSFEILTSARAFLERLLDAGHCH